ncbi:hypothetical protein E4U30_007631 [Claviceps sp. LM220 group G6]|nr:hypothetical protein E4U30_007631 [Claviceps sp. LM220 group G6]
MAGAFPLIQESSSMEYTTNEDKIFYWPGPPILGEMVADDLGEPPPKNEKNDCRNRERSTPPATFGSFRAGPGNGTQPPAEEELSRRLTECDGWPVMVPEEDERAWIEVPACDKSTEWTPDVFRTHMIEAARQREVALGFVSDLLATVSMQNGHIEAMAKHTNKITKHSETVCQDLLDQVRVLTDKARYGRQPGGERGRRVPGAQGPVHSELGEPEEGEEREGSTETWKTIFYRKLPKQ